MGVSMGGSGSGPASKGAVPEAVKEAGRAWKGSRTPEALVRTRAGKGSVVTTGRVEELARDS